MRNGLFSATLIAAITVTGTIALGAQAPTIDSSLYLKAQQMVNNGEATAGRALVDSLVTSATPGSPQYAEGLYWRATLAPTATDAERDYRRIVVDYPLSPRVDDALLRMGQLELTRGDRDAALQHFQRLSLEHPDSPLRAKASYWTARALFEKNDLSHACTANADALTRVQPADVELKNQIDFQNQRCHGVVLATTAIPTTESEPVAAAMPVPVTPKPTHSKAPTHKIVPAAVVPPAAAPDTDTSTSPAPATAASTPVDTPAPVHTAVHAETHAGIYTVQVAAYYDRTQALALADKLKTRGYNARVDGTVAPFRVHIGHYTTHAQAAEMLAKLKAKKMDGFVTTSP